MQTRIKKNRLLLTAFILLNMLPGLCLAAPLNEVNLGVTVQERKMTDTVNDISIVSPENNSQKVADAKVLGVTESREKDDSLKYIIVFAFLLMVLSVYFIKRRISAKFSI